MDRQSESGAIGGQGQRSGIDTGKFHFNTPAVSIGGKVQDGDEFVLLVRSKQSDGFTAWSSTSQTDTPQLVQQAMRQLNLEPATT